MYGHGYEIEDLIKENFYLETMESRLDRISFEIYQLSLGAEAFADDVRDRWNLEYVQKKAQKLLEKYCYPDHLEEE